MLGELAIWPNPVRDQINIFSNAPADTRVILTLMDMQGRPIQNQTQILGPSAGQVELSASQLMSGIYLKLYSQIMEHLLH
ncbi:MAG: T9SS type A sorting domain-containing protein [Saprospiraceae bacterium]|nr:T9SS type A sorting domain-containing protein [Saprospiraceae bacterium]